MWLERTVAFSLALVSLNLNIHSCLSNSAHMRVPASTGNVTVCALMLTDEGWGVKSSLQWLMLKHSLAPQRSRKRMWKTLWSHFSGLKFHCAQLIPHKSQAHRAPPAVPRMPCHHSLECHRKTQSVPSPGPVCLSHVAVWGEETVQLSLKTRAPSSPPSPTTYAFSGFFWKEIPGLWQTDDHCLSLVLFLVGFPSEGIIRL